MSDENEDASFHGSSSSSSSEEEEEEEVAATTTASPQRRRIWRSTASINAMNALLAFNTATMDLEDDNDDDKNEAKNGKGNNSNISTMGREDGENVAATGADATRLEEAEEDNANANAEYDDDGYDDVELINEELFEADPPDVNTTRTSGEPFTLSNTLLTNATFVTILEMAGIGDDDDEEEDQEGADKNEDGDAVGGDDAEGVAEVEIEQEMMKLLEQQHDTSITAAATTTATTFARKRKYPTCHTSV